MYIPWAEKSSDQQRTISLRLVKHWKTGETISAAIYVYQVDNDGEWGEIRFDFEHGTTEIVRLADWDTVKSNVCARAVIRYVLGFPADRLPEAAVI